MLKIIISVPKLIKVIIGLNINVHVGLDKLREYHVGIY
jgi:hypothetical protein